MNTNIDFDQASYEWRKNKIRTTNGSFMYTCGIVTYDGSICKNMSKSPQWQLCDDHKVIYCLHMDCLESLECYRS